MPTPAGASAKHLPFSPYDTRVIDIRFKFCRLSSFRQCAEKSIPVPSPAEGLAQANLIAQIVGAGQLIELLFGTETIA